MTQLSLLERDRVRAAKLLDRLVDLLAAGTWMKGRDLCRVLHTDERTLRKIAELSDGRILSGQSGYKLTRYATPEDMAEFEGRQLSQIAKTKERLMKTQRRWHGRAA